MWLLWWESWHQSTQHFPEARITLSALLPRTDVPFHMIHGNNVELSRSCALISNVHLAHHKDIRPHHMHDHVHLNKQGVKVFARVMKSTALGNAPGNSRNYNNKRSPHPTRSPHPPTEPRAATGPAITTQKLCSGSLMTTKPCSCRTQPDKTSAELRLSAPDSWYKSHTFTYMYIYMHTLYRQTHSWSLLKSVVGIYRVCSALFYFR